MNELQIVVNQELGTITTNFDTLKLAVIAKAEEYKKLDVTEENKAKIKKRIAELRSDIKTINEKRITVKKICLEPYFGFENKTTEVIEVYNGAISSLDSQVKEIEEKQRLAKIDQINGIYAELVGDLVDDLSIEQIYDSKWENKATSDKSIREDITAKLDRIKQDISTIKSMQSDKQEDALNSYWIDLNLAKSISMINTYEDNKRRILAQEEEKRRREEEAAIERERQRIRDEERARVREEERIREEERAKAQAEEDRIREEERLSTEQKLMGVKAPDAKEKVGFDNITKDYTEMVTYKIIATAGECEMFEMYLNSIGVEFLKGDF